MPKKPSPRASGSADVHTRPAQSTDAQHPRSDPLLRVDVDPLHTLHPSVSRESSPGIVDPDLPTATASVRVTEMFTPTTESVAVLRERHRPIIAQLGLPEADAQGFRLFKERLYVDLPDGVLQVGVDPQTGRYRAKKPSERIPSGPELEFDPVSKFWVPSDLKRLADRADAVPGRSRREPDTGRSDDEFELASEAMPIAHFTERELVGMRHEVHYSIDTNALGSYDRVNNGKYPIRDRFGRPVRIRMLEREVVLETGERYTSEQIKPYIKYQGHEQVARLYEEKLQWRRFTEADVKVPGEAALIGQSMVVANRRIAKGEAIGVYGGTLRPGRFLQANEMTFAMSVANNTLQANVSIPGMHVVGDNIISRINTNFTYDAVGKPVAQAPDGYNLQVVGFTVEADLLTGDKPNRNKYSLNAFFATQDIPAGTELRWDYNYSDEAMKILFP
ncbi:hypothetical protein ACIQVE_15540 [Pseudomonas sp. NPDC098747]|uniref:hypothetical protein n=1 Tax=Pseudomonas sp. NPDC098747 TaxID=3364487 RepID=UPI00383B32E1